jgi:prepilin-type N-terminal cleavage/methylation domain-containing protein
MRQTSKHGFTLTELLIVLAVIAILVAIAFPVFSRAREQTRQTTCMSQMHAINIRVKLYREDEGAYPYVIVGYAKHPDGNYYTGKGPFQPLPQPKYFQSNTDMYCPDNPTTEFRNDERLRGEVLTTAEYPINYIPTRTMLGGIFEVAPLLPAYFFRYDSYDIGPRVDKQGQPVLAGGKPVYELHYTQDWTGADRTGPQDAPNQLKYPHPPEDTTVVCWCTYHAAATKMIPVLMLSGKVKPVPVAEMVIKGPLEIVR